MINIKIIFMGTPAFAIPILDKLMEKNEITLIVTQPDQVNSRKKTVVFSPVKQWAIEHNIEVFQPDKISKENQKIFSTEADIIITAAYGQFLNTALLEYPRYKAINIHGSLLPKYRGGAPIQRAIINGDQVTGISIMYMAKQMDAGDILAMKEIPISLTDTQDTLFAKLSALASSMIQDVLDGLEKGSITPVPQDLSKVSFAYNLTKEDEKITFNASALEVHNLIRGLNFNPGAYFVLDNTIIKVYNSSISDKKTTESPGKIIAINKNNFEVSCKNGSVIAIESLQMPSKNIISARDFINGAGRKMIYVGKVIEVN